MTTPHDHDQIRSLLAAYALDAVDRDEVETVEQHLVGCPECRAEVADHRETAGALAASPEPAPQRLWDAIASTLEIEALPNRGNVRPFAKPGRRRSSWLAAAAAAVLLALLGVRVADLGRQVDQLEESADDRSILAAALAADRDPDARRVELRSVDGVVLARVVLVDDGTGYLWGEGLPRTDATRTYQLWAVIGGEPISVGVLGSAPRVTPFQVAADVTALAVTEEVAGGVVASKNPPVAVGEVTSS